MSDVKNWGIHQPGDVWRDSSTRGQLSPQIQEIFGRGARVSDSWVDDRVFEPVGFRYVFAIRDRHLVLVMRQSSGVWYEVASCPVPDTWEEARDWLRMVARLHSAA